MSRKERVRAGVSGAPAHCWKSWLLQKTTYTLVVEHMLCQEQVCGVHEGGNCQSYCPWLKGQKFVVQSACCAGKDSFSAHQFASCLLACVSKRAVSAVSA